MLTVCNHRHAQIFINPVTDEIAPGYSSIMHRPMDLGMAKRRIEAVLAPLAGTNVAAQSSPNALNSPNAVIVEAATMFIQDLLLMFSNARMYNASSHEVYRMSEIMYRDVINELKPVWSVLAEDIPNLPQLPSATPETAWDLLDQQPSMLASGLSPPVLSGTATPTVNAGQSLVNVSTPPTTYSGSRASSQMKVIQSNNLKLPPTDPLVAERTGKVRDVCGEAVWCLSSCKVGHGIDQLLDNRLDLFWQSDGPQPHLVTMLFNRRTWLSDLYLYFDYQLDESYTPSRLSVRCGDEPRDLFDVVEVMFREPVGWHRIPLEWMDQQPVKTFVLQIAMFSNHQNGRDTHIRGIRVHSPVENRGFKDYEWPLLKAKPESSDPLSKDDFFQDKEPSVMSFDVR
ncbi:hypothetical protein Ciccas_001154 [Cichlidogyrus casuarinus]|uniref:Anaphase-promoting complex subunit 10 n=1 Tax=Cichlidogyrus casuarinus TaxID=1844966 RepID=A0ABD2QN81_9PLAT